MLRINHATLGRGRKTKDPCPGCALHRERCICALTPHLNLRTKLTLIVHAKELKRTTNSGRLALRALVNSEAVVRGLGAVRVPLHEGFRPLLLYPGEGSRELTPALLAESPLPIQLLVPDGNWRQAAKVASRQKELAGVERVQISAPNEALHHLRKEVLAHGMSTLEAIAKALRVLEGEAAYDRLYGFYQAKLSATLAGRRALVGDCKA